MEEQLLAGNYSKTTAKAIQRVNPMPVTLKISPKSKNATGKNPARKKWRMAERTKTRNHHHRVVSSLHVK